MEVNECILTEARKQRYRIADTLSVDLPPIREEFSGKLIDTRTEWTLPRRCHSLDHVASRRIPGHPSPLPRRRLHRAG